MKPDIIEFAQMKQRLRDVWPDLKNGDFVTGDEILGRLLGN